LRQLVKRLGVSEYDHPSEFCTDERRTTKVEIPLTQHVGNPATPIVRIGDSVKKGQCIGEIPDGKLGARVHASIDGKVRHVGESILIHHE
ncbi:MAG: electron transport complex protein RnfC, partial [Bacteroidota bacterium]